MKSKVEADTDDYAFREYGVTQKQMAGLEKVLEKRYQRLKRAGKLVTLTSDQLRKMAAESTTK